MACFLLVVNNLTIIRHVLLFSTELEIPQDSLKFHLKAATLWEFKVNSCSAFGVIPTFSFQSPQTKFLLAKSHWTSWGARCPFTPLSYAWAVWVKVAKPLLAPTSKHISTFLVFIGHFCCRNVQVNILFFVKITWWFESLPCEIMNEGTLALFFALEAQFNWCGGVWSCSLTKDIFCYLVGSIYLELYCQELRIEEKNWRKLYTWVTFGHWLPDYLCVLFLLMTFIYFTYSI